MRRWRVVLEMALDETTPDPATWSWDLLLDESDVIVEESREITPVVNLEVSDGEA